MVLLQLPVKYFIMSNLFDRFGKIQVKYSITNTDLQFNNTIKDSNAPYTLIQWVENSNVDFGNVDEYMSHYNEYTVYIKIINIKQTQFTIKYN